MSTKIYILTFDACLTRVRCKCSPHAQCGDAAVQQRCEKLTNVVSHRTNRLSTRTRQA